MVLKYSQGFLIASLIQASIIFLTEILGISSLGVKFTFTQILLHILFGQFAGYVLLNILDKYNAMNSTKTLVTGSTFGILVWVIVLSLNTMLGNIKAPWNQGFSSMLSSIMAFIVYGIISTNTINKYSYVK